MLVLSSKFTNKTDSHAYQKAVNAFKSDSMPNMTTLMAIFELGTVYEGTWEKLA